MDSGKLDLIEWDHTKSNCPAAFGADGRVVKKLFSDACTMMSKGGHKVSMACEAIWNSRAALSDRTCALFLFGQKAGIIRCLEDPSELLTHLLDRRVDRDEE